VLLRGPCTAGGDCADARLVVQDAHGTRVAATGPHLEAGSLAGTGATVFWRAGGHAASLTLAT
jgi:hypothetical protein